MWKPIPRVGHAFTDYPYIATVSVAPKLFGFADEPRAVQATRFLSSAILTSSFFTRAEWGFIRVMPFRTHLMVDVSGGVVALAAPWALGFSQNTRARNFFLALAAIAFLVGPLSDPEEMP